MVYPEEVDVEGQGELELVYDNGKVCEWDDFDTVRKRVSDQFKNLPPVADPISSALNDKIRRVKLAQEQVNSSRDTA